VTSLLGPLLRADEPAPGEVRLCGELDVCGEAALAAHLEAVAARHDRVVVDCAGLTFADLRGARALLDVARRRPRTALVVRRPPPSLAVVLAFLDVRGAPLPGQ